MDPLSDVLKVAHLSGGVFLHAEFAAPWCTAIRVAPELCAPLLGSASHLIPYHHVVEGELQVRVEGGAPFVLRTGEVVLFPRNDSHLLGSDLDPVRLAMARHNLGNDVDGVVRADALAPVSRDTVVLADPGRRGGGRRRFDPADYLRTDLGGSAGSSSDRTRRQPVSG